MHDTDRTFTEYGESFEFQSEGAGFGETSGEVLGEDELNELAGELLGVSNEQELDRFLGNIFKKVAGAASSFVRSPLGRQLGGMLKGVAKQALPMAGAALGNLVMPGVGGAIGSKLASAAGSAFGLETQGLSEEDREWEGARQFVRLAADATRNAVQASPGADASQTARQAVDSAVRRHAPAIAAGGLAAGRAGQSGRWVRRGNKIIVYGV